MNLKTMNKCIAGLKDKDVPAAYWTAAAWAQRINLEKTSTKSLLQSRKEDMELEGKE